MRRTLLFPYKSDCSFGCVFLLLLFFCDELENNLVARLQSRTFADGIKNNAPEERNLLAQV